MARRRRAYGRFLAVGGLVLAALACGFGMVRFRSVHGRIIGVVYRLPLPEVGLSVLQMERVDGNWTGKLDAPGYRDPVYLTSDLSSPNGVLLRSRAPGEDDPEPAVVLRLDADVGVSAGTAEWFPGTNSPAARLPLTPMAEVRERRRRYGFDIAGYGASLAMRARWPVFRPGPDRDWDAVNRIVRERVDAWTRIQWAENRPDFWAGLRERAASDVWDSALGARVVHADADCVSLHVVLYEYTGGAHGNSWHEGWNLRRDDGVWRPFGLADLFRADTSWDTWLSRETIGQLRVLGATSIPTEFAKDDFPAFTVNARGLRLHFDPYAVGSYAEGSYEVSIPWERLGQFLAPGWPPAAE